MKAIEVGLGAAGYSWYKKLRDNGMLAAVVEMNPALKHKMADDPYPFYTSLEEALDNERPDFIVNVTPPMIHTPVNHAAFDRKIPVLCEKPIAFSYEQSVQVVQRAQRESIPFMVRSGRFLPSMFSFTGTIKCKGITPSACWTISGCIISI